MYTSSAVASRCGLKSNNVFVKFTQLSRRSFFFSSFRELMDEENEKTWCEEMKGFLIQFFHPFTLILCYSHNFLTLISVFFITLRIHNKRSFVCFHPVITLWVCFMFFNFFIFTSLRDLTRKRERGSICSLISPLTYFSRYCWFFTFMRNVFGGSFIR